jgi:hypothetical protein
MVDVTHFILMGTSTLWPRRGTRHEPYEQGMGTARGTTAYQSLLGALHGQASCGEAFPDVMAASQPQLCWIEETT